MKPAAPRAPISSHFALAAAVCLGILTLAWAIWHGASQASHFLLGPMTCVAAITTWRKRGQRRPRSILFIVLSLSALIHLSHFLTQPVPWAGAFAAANAFLILALAPPLPFTRSRDSAETSCPGATRSVQPPAAPGRPPSLTSLVLLLTKPRSMSAAELQQLAGDAWGGNYNDPVESLNASSFRIRSIHGVFHVHSLSSPYWPDATAIASLVIDPARRRAILSHEAWIGVDLVESPAAPGNLHDLYAPVIRLLVELADPEDTLAVFRPETGQINVWNDEVFGLLVGPNGLENFSRQLAPGAYRVAEEDARVLEASRHAQLRFPEFRAAFDHRRAGDLFSVKVLVIEGSKSECIWIHVEALHHETIEGRLANHPIELPSLRYGSLVAVRIADLHDWAYRLGTDDDAPVIGLFSAASTKPSDPAPRFPFRDAP